MQKARKKQLWGHLVRQVEAAAKLLLFLNKNSCFALAKRILPFGLYARSPAHVPAHNAHDPPRSLRLMRPPDWDAGTHILAEHSAARRAS